MNQNLGFILNRVIAEHNLVLEGFSKEQLWKIINTLHIEIEKLKSDKNELLEINKELIEIATLLNIDVKAP